MTKWSNHINDDWYPLLEEFLNSKEMEHILAVLKSQSNVLPEQSRVFRAFNCSPYKTTKVIILGQD